jgi:riboflavin kinase/FMN adenylyltransferase
MAQVTVSAVTYGGDSVSSSRIRALIAEGDVSGARELLTRPFSLQLPVLCGKMLGRRLGFPTANQLPHDNAVCPASGVYATAVEIGEGERSELYAGCSNVGVCPTVTRETLELYGTDTDGEGAATENRPMIETYIDGFSGDLYGKSIRVHFLRRIRGEKRFDSLDELRAQIKADSAEAVRIFEECKHLKGGCGNDAR